MTGQKWATHLSILSLAGQALAYVLGIVLARQLGVAGFESYVVAAAAFILMVTLVPQGLEKYSLKLLPGLIEHRRGGLLHGFLRFSSRRVLLGSVLVGGLVALGAWNAEGLARQTRIAIAISCLSLPAGALVHLALEVLTAFGRAFVATLVFRMLVPGTVLILAGVAVVLLPGLNASLAIAAWGVAWCLALGVMGMQVRRATPAGTWQAPVVEDGRRWAAEARPFWIYRVSLAVLLQAGIVALEALQSSPTAIGGFAAALGTAAIAQVLATATNRVYASRLQLLLERGDIAGIQRLRGERLRWLAAPLLVYLLVMFVFAPELVGLFRPEFVDDGAPALRILAASTALSTVLAMAPTFLKHQSENRVLFRTVAAAAVLQVGMLVALVPSLGAAGAAIAHALAAVFMYGTLAWLAHRGLARLQSPSGN